ncbi:MAG: pantoate--beta-alanine ligase [Planctomycetia bacterium]|nr:pantoate--beta-alanine ligase [Planctomycetia bacterium]
MLIHSREELRENIRKWRNTQAKIGLVPTMGALHEGHLSLVRQSLEECDKTVVSIFVNPIQFGPGEDFSRYPRTLDADVALLEKMVGEERDRLIVFSPDAETMYSPGFCTHVVVGGPALPLEGEKRPGHFQGVATVVLKLMLMTQADMAYFGQKDFQQAAVILRMVEDLDVPVCVKVCPIIREEDGLAMSSRNRYLSPEGRKQATVLYESLSLAEQLLRAGERHAPTLERNILEILHKKYEKEQVNYIERVDYVNFVDPKTLESVTEIGSSVVILLAVYVDGTRLIDNFFIDNL